MHTHEAFVEHDVHPRATHAASSEHADAAGALAVQPKMLDARAVLALQRAAGNAGVTTLLSDEEGSPVRDVVESGGGEPLAGATRSLMESRFDNDFSDVRVHTDAKASDSAKSVNAHAYTVGSNVVFRSGMYEPESERGQRLLAHELTHVVQQRSGPVSGTPAPGGILLSDPSDAFEQAAERSADRVMAGEATSAGPAAAPSVQREEAKEEEEPTAQTFSVQREDEDDQEGA
jgi:Domain of unknown function (DUF4157)